MLSDVLTKWHGQNFLTYDICLTFDTKNMSMAVEIKRLNSYFLFSEACEGGILNPLSAYVIS